MLYVSDLKSADPKGLWGFKSPSRHHHYCTLRLPAINLAGFFLFVCTKVCTKGFEVANLCTRAVDRSSIF